MSDSEQRTKLNRFALGRQLTALANTSPQEMLDKMPSDAAKHQAQRIGLTGAPGSGKSTLGGQLAMPRLIRESAVQRLGILAIDPSSPKSGGAILGDRIRMDELPGSAELFSRSLGSRSTADGLTDNLPEMLDLMDSFEFDEVLIETVGVGQVEYAVRLQVDTLVLVLLPNSGDMVQAMKSGIMEMPDIFVVNKSDLSGADRTAADIERITALRKITKVQWHPQVLLVSNSKPESIVALSKEIDRHQNWLITSGEQQKIQIDRARYRLRRIIERRVQQVIDELGDTDMKQALPEQFEKVISKLRGARNSIECLAAKSGATPSGKG